MNTAAPAPGAWTKKIPTFVEIVQTNHSVASSVHKALSASFSQWCGCWVTQFLLVFKISFYFDSFPKMQSQQNIVSIGNFWDIYTETSEAISRSHRIPKSPPNPRAVCVVVTAAPALLSHKPPAHGLFIRCHARAADFFFESRR